jgi:multiple sugar transport system substrate-binding protein
MEFAPFPRIRDEIGKFEDAPMNSLHIPARAKNRQDAEKFLSFVARSDVQEKIASALRLIPVNTEARVGNDRFLQAGQELLADADQLMQYFDRDTSEDLATVAMKGFQEFMMRPERLDQVLHTIERARTRIYR